MYTGNIQENFPLNPTWSILKHGWAGYDENCSYVYTDTHILKNVSAKGIDGCSEAPLRFERKLCFFATILVLSKEVHNRASLV